MICTATALPARWASRMTMQVVLIMLPILATAQTRTFPAEKAGFLQEMTSFMVEADKKEGKPFMETVFTPAWNGAFFTDARATRVAALANAMAKKRFEAYPGFQDYLSSLAAFASSGRNEAEFDAWMKCLEAAAGSPRKQNLTDLIGMSAGLFKDNSFHNGANLKWRSSSRDFTFVYDSIPKVVWSAPMDIICLAKGDSARVLKTSGTYYPTRAIWEGKGGVITWERAGLDPKKTWAEWDHTYRVRTKSSDVEVDSVRFSDPYFDRKLLGKVEVKVMANVSAEKAGYPRFVGYDRRIKIKDIIDGIDFEGGFTMQGAKLQGAGTAEEPAFLTFYRDKRPFIISHGTIYTIEPGKISSEGVGVTIRLDNDSIHHPKVNLRFLKDKKQLTILKPDEGLSRGPFYDTYHKLDMFLEQITWTQGDPLLTLSNLQGSTQTRTSFESFNYFKSERYSALLGMDAVHPLARIREHQRAAGDKFLADDFARSTRLQKTQVVPMLIDLANKGYLDYDTETDMVHVKERLREHVLASAKKTDYDVLQLNSTAEENINGTINLLNNDLALRGVSKIVLSDSQDVRIYPSGRLVTVKKDRDLSFGGNIAAGKLNYYGKEYYFHYKPFIIDLLNVDSVSFYADSFDKDESGRTRLVRVKNVLEQVTGTLEIDAPSNKSGLQQDKYSEFPKFNSTQSSFVYYDKGAIQKGAYKRDLFYYKSDPFVIDSLDNFTNEGLTFTGVLMSGGIFPDIREPLRLQEDYALGFIRPTGAGGLPLYGKKAKFANTLKLDHKGLHGDGDLTYLTTIASSKDLYFTPDTTFGMADTLYNAAANNASMKVPNAHGSKLFLRLEPVKDVLLADVRGKPMVMYDGQAFLQGRTELTPTGMTGAGLIDYKNATLSSELFQFTTTATHADTSDFRLTDGDASGIAFRTDNVNATIKLDERIGEFVSNGSETKVEFPVNQYICFMDRFKWYMDQGDIELEADRTAAAGSDDLQLSGSNFISTHAQQDSLSFMAPKARYDLKRHIITANDVRFIQVADALITPDSMRVRIGRNAEMGTLRNASIVANNVTRYHEVHNAVVDIKARRNYKASGEYHYVDETDRKYTIQLPEITVDTSFQTQARGVITKDEGFQLSPAFDYFGDVQLRASVQGLIFTGSTRILHDCPGIERNWMKFSAAVDPKEVFLPVGDSLRDATGEDIGAGIFLTNEDPFKTYGTFLSRKVEAKDRPIIKAKGLLFYDKAKKEYIISNKDKIRQRDLPGDLVSLNTNSCRLTGDGHILTGMDLGRVKVDGYGTLDYRGDSAITDVRVTMPIEFHFFDNALEKMVTDMMTYPDQKVVDITKTPYEKSLREILGKEKSDKFVSELSIKGEIKRLPDELARTLVLADVRMRWNGADEAWQSEGLIGVGTVGKKSVFRYLKGKVEFERKRSGDVMTVMLMLDEQTYWFFQYSRGQMLTLSSDVNFNGMISELKEDKTKLESKKDEPAYNFMLTNKRKVEDFRDRFGF